MSGESEYILLILETIWFVFDIFVRNKFESEQKQWRSQGHLMGGGQKTEVRKSPEVRKIFGEKGEMRKFFWAHPLQNARKGSFLEEHPKIWAFLRQQLFDHWGAIAPLAPWLRH